MKQKIQIIANHTSNGHSAVDTALGQFIVSYLRSYSDAPHIILSVTLDGQDVTTDVEIIFW